jgi:hypothetical protein
VPVRSFMLHFILYHFFLDFFVRFFVLSSCGSPSPTLNFVTHPPPSSQSKMIEKYEKFYVKISVDSGLFLSSQLFPRFFLLCFENLLNFLFNIFTSCSGIIMSSLLLLLVLLLLFGENMKFSINP